MRNYNIIDKFRKTRWTNDTTTLAPVETLKVGCVVKVGKFFWIGDGNIVGFSEDAVHGHGIDEDHAGSVDIDCHLKVLKITLWDNILLPTAIVELDRPEIPYGAPAAIGIRFKMPLKMLHEWEIFIAVDWKYPCLAKNKYTDALIFFTKKGMGRQVEDAHGFDDGTYHNDMDMYSHAPVELPEKEWALMLLKYGGKHG